MMTDRFVEMGTHYYFPDPSAADVDERSSGITVQVVQTLWRIGNYDLPFKVPFSNKELVVRIDDKQPLAGGHGAISQELYFRVAAAALGKNGLITLAGDELARRAQLIQADLEERGIIGPTATERDIAYFSSDYGALCDISVKIHRPEDGVLKGTTLVNAGLA